MLIRGNNKYNLWKSIKWGNEERKIRNTKYRNANVMNESTHANKHNEWNEMKKMKNNNKSIPFGAF